MFIDLSNPFASFNLILLFYFQRKFYSIYKVEHFSENNRFFFMSNHAK